jgi:LDH2 family malate/lactate/ureidoglycolate dehydrogenase
VIMHLAATSEFAAHRVSVDELERFCRQALAAAGADQPTVDAAARALMHGSTLGIDSHGIRLLDHYVQAFEGGRVNREPRMRFIGGNGAVGTLDADDAHGALATYRAMEETVKLARRTAIGAVAVQNSSHFGPAGAYALEAANAGLVGIVMCNSDSFVRLHDGAARFHGTNPIACAVPVDGERPWLLDMATSAIPYNRIQLYRSMGCPLPDGTASALGGHDTTDPNLAEMLAPLGGEFGFKGAGLAGLVEVFSAVLTGMRLSFDIPPMAGPDFATPRKLGAFVIAMRTDAFVSSEVFADGMRRYLAALRESPAITGLKVMAPGDREWAEADRRMAEGIPIDPETLDALDRLARRLSLEAPRRKVTGG